MAKKDTYLALLRRGIDETTSQLLSDSGLKIGDLKKLDEEKLVNNYGIKKEIAKSKKTSNTKPKFSKLCNSLQKPTKSKYFTV